MNLIEYVGRFHPLLVHLPIGILIFALVIDAVEWKRPSFQSPINTQLILWIGTFAALLSVGSGYVLAQSGDYPIEELNLHKRLGFLTCFFFLIYSSFRNLIITKKSAHAFTTLIGMLLLILTGHKGGSLTHGSSYLYELVNVSTHQDNQTSIDPLDENELKSFEKLGWVVSSVSQEDGRLRIVGFNLEGSIKDALKYIVNFPEHIEELKLSYSSVSDEDIETLTKLIRLKKVWLDNTAVSDSCIGFLMRLEGLTYINLSNTRITEKGLEKLKAGKKGVKIYGPTHSLISLPVENDSTSASD
ncbi:MAG: hypothetical protein RIQ50_1617 [Bacteroidota bacterium]